MVFDSHDWGSLLHELYNSISFEVQAELNADTVKLLTCGAFHSQNSKWYVYSSQLYYNTVQNTDFYQRNVFNSDANLKHNSAKILQNYGWTSNKDSVLRIPGVHSNFIH